ncbi:hypothetical protein COO60DRAFT_1530234 [Scenedesmus sp. NREL 46B-D3]|nr:hypothetical protein COO60DRAFT_1530234 [Scenedesmus sp. NREL 46B-D3]
MRRTLSLTNALSPAQAPTTLRLPTGAAAAARLAAAACGSTAARTLLLLLHQPAWQRLLLNVVSSSSALLRWSTCQCWRRPALTALGCPDCTHLQPPGRLVGLPACACPESADTSSSTDHLLTGQLCLLLRLLLWPCSAADTALITRTPVAAGSAGGALHAAHACCCCCACCEFCAHPTAAASMTP